MAKSVNKVILLGNVGRAPEYKYTPGGTAFAKFSLATSYRVKVGEAYEDATEWHDCVVYGKLADVVREYVGKGSKLYLEGRLKTHSWEDKDSGKMRYRTEIIVADLTLIGGKREGGDDSRYAEPAAADPGEITDDDIPF